MSLETSIMGLIVTLIVLIPIYFFERKRKRNRKMLIKSAKEKSARQGLVITDFDQWNNYFIGLDKKSNKLFYSDNPVTYGSDVIIDLNLISKCEKVVLSKTVKAKGGSDTVIEKISLRLSFIPKLHVSDIMLEFFNSDKAVLPDREYEYVDKWSRMIKSALTAA